MKQGEVSEKKKKKERRFKVKLVNRENKLGRHLPLTAFWVTGEKARENGEGEKQDKRACA